ncbi:MAG: hypothetical protein GX410_03345 [Elusimicrobia bacterium]|nr:hypothetical protein [Elusimicrobiota bacterium]
MLKNKTLALVLALALPSTALAAGKAVSNDLGFKTTMEAAEAPAMPAMEKIASKNTVKDWTIMVFINGKNNLEKYGYMDVNEMEMVGSTDDKNVVVELGVPSGSKRMLIVKDNDRQNITSPAVQTIAKADMGDYKHLADFVKWAKATYPAKHYMLTVWNHGAGWLKSKQSKGISYDDETRNHISTPQLAQALAMVGGVDVYTSDACLMQMAEVVTELAPYAKYVVGSEETEGGDGYTYNTMLTDLPSDPKEVALHVAKTANAYYSSDATQSVVDTSKVEKLPAALDAWTETVMTNLSTGAVKNIARQTKSYAYADNKDLVDFVTRANGAMTSAYEAQIAELSARNDDASTREIAKLEGQIKNITKAGDKLVQFLTSELVIGNFTSSNMKGSNGLAIYIPNYSTDKNYAELQWAQNSKWADFLKWMQAR